MSRKKENIACLQESGRLDTRIPMLGEAKVESPIKTIPMVTRDGRVMNKTFVADGDQVLVNDTREYLSRLQPGEEPLFFEMFSKAECMLPPDLKQTRAVSR